MCSSVDFGSGDVDHAFDIQDLCFDLADADDKVFLFVPGFGQAVKVVLNSFLHRRFDGRPGGRTGKSQRERHVDRGSGHTFDRDDVSDRGDTVTDALVLNRIDDCLNAVDKVGRRDSPVTIYKDTLSLIPDNK